MKSEGLILASVIGICGLFGLGVSQATAPVVHSVESMVSDSGAQQAGKIPASLKKDLEAHYPGIVLSDDALTSLACGPANFLGQKDCYNGPTTELKKYGKATVTVRNTPTYVQLTSMPSGAFLYK